VGCRENPSASTAITVRHFEAEHESS
jgi:hypothetical protein